MEFNLYSNSIVECTVISPILKRGKLLFRNIKQLAQGPRLAEWQSRQHRIQIHAKLVLKPTPLIPPPHCLRTFVSS